MTPVRTRRGRRVHLTADLRVTLCNRPLTAPIVEPDAAVDCKRCLAAKA